MTPGRAADHKSQAGSLALAVVTEVFHGDRAEDRLGSRLAEAAARGAALALLPELPLDPWVPAHRDARDEDAEPPGGPRHRLLARAAERAGVGVVGGAIVRDAETGARNSIAVVFDGRGELRARYRKIHLPQEEGFWEASHYGPGTEPPHVVDAFGLRIGLQICSDVNRPELSHVLGAMGAEAILAPRATPAASYERWKLVLRANAVTSGAYVVSTNRTPEPGVDVGGPSVVIAPDGEVLLETEDPLAVVTLEREAVRRARDDYPGYLDVNADLYARAWSLASRTE